MRDSQALTKRKRKDWFPSIAEAKRRYAHGTHARYVLARCRCAPCSRANRNYEQARVDARRPPWEMRYSPSANHWVVRNKATGHIAYRSRSRPAALAKLARLNAHHIAPNTLISAEKTRAHLHTLQACGLGIKTIARAAHVSYSCLRRLYDGEIVRTRQSYEQKILAITAAAIKDGASVRADDSLVLIHRLILAGYTRAWIAKRLGKRRGALMLTKSPWIQVRHARALHAIYVDAQRKTTALPRINPAFQIGITESSYRRSKYPHRIQQDLSVANPRRFSHGTCARYIAGCRCHRCISINDEYQRALTQAGHYRYVLRNSRGGQRVDGWFVQDVRAEAVVYRSQSRRMAEKVRDQLNTSEASSAPNVLIGTKPIADHVRAMYQSGLSDEQIAKACHVTINTIFRLRHRRGAHIRSHTAQRILSVDLSTVSVINTNPRVPAASCNLLIERLLAAGFERRWLDHLLGFATITLRASRTRLERARAVMALYQNLAERLPVVRALEKIPAL